jgi:pimeloyl-ACP methyl ester carboxylesterase
MRGYGRSAKPRAVHDYRITELVADLVDLVHALGEQQAIVVGHDWGSPIAWGLDLHWELLAPFAGKPVPVPALFIGGDRDVATIWGREAIDLYPKTVPELHRNVVLNGCGHWTQQERPAETTSALLDFFAAVG